MKKIIFALTLVLLSFSLVSCNEKNLEIEAFDEKIVLSEKDNVSNDSLKKVLASSVVNNDLSNFAFDISLDLSVLGKNDTLEDVSIKTNALVSTAIELDSINKVNYLSCLGQADVQYKNGDALRSFNLAANAYIENEFIYGDLDLYLISLKQVDVVDELKYENYEKVEDQFSKFSDSLISFDFESMNYEFENRNIVKINSSVKSFEKIEGGEVYVTYDIEVRNGKAYLIGVDFEFNNEISNYLTSMLNDNLDKKTDNILLKTLIRSLRLDTVKELTSSSISLSFAVTDKKAVKLTALDKAEFTK